MTTKSDLESLHIDTFGYGSGECAQCEARERVYVVAFDDDGGSVLLHESQIESAEDDESSNDS